MKGISQGNISNKIMHGEQLFENYAEDTVLELVYNLLEER